MDQSFGSTHEWYNEEKDYNLILGKYEVTNWVGGLTVSYRWNIQCSSDQLNTVFKKYISVPFRTLVSINVCNPMPRSWEQGGPMQENIIHYNKCDHHISYVNSYFWASLIFEQKLFMYIELQTFRTHQLMNLRRNIV